MATIVIENANMSEDWSEKIDINWDTQYIKINNVVPGMKPFTHGAFCFCLSNENTQYYLEVDETGMLIHDFPEWVNIWLGDFNVEIRKDNITFTNSYNGNVEGVIPTPSDLISEPYIYIGSVGYSGENAYDYRDTTIDSIKVCMYPVYNIKSGSSQVDDVYIGSEKVKKVYIGDTVVFAKEEE